MSPYNTHKLMGFYMEVLILGVIYTSVQSWFSASLTLYCPITPYGVMTFVKFP